MGAQPVPAPGREPVPISQSGWKRITQSRLARLLTKFILLPLLGVLVSGIIIGRVANKIFGPAAYHIYVVGAMSDSAVAPLLEAVRGGDLDPVHDIKIETRTADDSGDPDKAQRLSEQLAGQPDTLMVVGHIYSTETQRALPAYLNLDPPIPVILTTETNPNLLPPQIANGHYAPVFRLSPTDDNQAEVAADFVARQGAKAVWVVEDTTNPTYSKYLAREFVQRVHQRSPKVLLWSTNVNLPPAYAVDQLKIDWVFFAGEWQNALILIRQLKAMPGTRNARVVLTDSAADTRLLQDGGQDIEGAYLLHALSATEFTTNGYAAFGRDALALARALTRSLDQDFDRWAVEEAPVGYRVRKWLGLRRVSDARRGLAHVMRNAVFERTTFMGATGQLGPFINDGTRTDARFHVWQIRNNGFAEVQ